MKMVNPERTASVEWHDGVRIWKGLNRDGVWEESRTDDTEKGQRQEVAALRDMGWHLEH